MSIVKLKKMTAYGHTDDKEKILNDFQDMGCLHLIPLNIQEDLLHNVGPTSESRDALKFLTSCPQRLQQMESPVIFDAADVEHDALEIKRQIEELEDDRDFFRVRIKGLKPWGYFTFPSLEDLGNFKLWFYEVPYRQMAEVESTKLVWEVISRNNRISYVVVISENEPEGMPVERTRTGNKSPADLEKRLAETERKLETLQTRRVDLTKWIYLFTRSIYSLEDKAERMRAGGETIDETPIFAMQAWIPENEIARIQEYVSKEGMAMEIEKPEREDNPPTLLKNRPVLASGQDLVTFYTTPGYWLWDPSTIVLFSFAVFFAMIISDAAYGIVLGIGLGLLWKRMGKTLSGRRLRVLGTMLFSATVIYGILVGSYFGISPSPGSFPAQFKIIDMQNFDVMMKISIFLGIGHLILANAMRAWLWRWSLAMLSPIGWIFIFTGAPLIWIGASTKESSLPLDRAGSATMIAGAVAILFFSSVKGPLWKRLLVGIKSLARLTSAFGDTLSYLRLFALGLASASLAVTFNDLASQVGASVKGVGFLFSLLIIILGHSLNLLLAFASGIIHGLRLNFMEFFNWSMPEEGYPFMAFERKEKTSWTTISYSR
jgi:V/A-type H+-transporting ATPase subunit I